jgi:hypothetical protein
VTTYRASEYAKATKAENKRMVTALNKTAALITTELRARGRADLKTAGKFASWAFKVSNRKKGTDRLITTTTSFVAESLELGRTIRGRPLLWIPLSTQKDATKVLMRNYPKKLIRIERPGKLPLMALSGGGPVKYFGKTQIVMPKKLHLRQIGRDIMNRAPATYSRVLAESGNAG